MALFLDSQPGDLVGGDIQQTHTRPAVTFVVQRAPWSDGIINIRVNGPYQLDGGLRRTAGAPTGMRSPFAGWTRDCSGGASATISINVQTPSDLRSDRQ